MPQKGHRTAEKASTVRTQMDNNTALTETTREISDDMSTLQASPNSQIGLVPYLHQEMSQLGCSIENLSRLFQDVFSMSPASNEAKTELLLAPGIPQIFQTELSSIRSSVQQCLDALLSSEYSKKGNVSVHSERHTHPEDLQKQATDGLQSACDTQEDEEQNSQPVIRNSEPILDWSIYNPESSYPQATETVQVISDVPSSLGVSQFPQTFQPSPSASPVCPLPMYLPTKPTTTVGFEQVNWYDDPSSDQAYNQDQETFVTTESGGQASFSGPGPNCQVILPPMWQVVTQPYPQTFQPPPPDQYPPAVFVYHPNVIFPPNTAHPPPGLIPWPDCQPSSSVPVGIVPVLDIGRFPPPSMPVQQPTSPGTVRPYSQTALNLPTPVLLKGGVWGNACPTTNGGNQSYRCYPNSNERPTNIRQRNNSSSNNNNFRRSWRPNRGRGSSGCGDFRGRAADQENHFRQPTQQQGSRHDHGGRYANHSNNNNASFGNRKNAANQSLNPDPSTDSLANRD